ncbi:TniQ family protein [Paenibacillus filicis]|uniref:TniQ family protein n=1 Tax=Paenibacillus gyeongsangnamensis TaxID=3388067 RepID=A0ABT4QC66_9BACL|nr:TniQ family protein [Paenibacillus filicis]MCZ8514357.1 TniQ family protein [Paenibacillus filicis]
MKPLLNRPQIYTDESVEGYMYRLAQANHREVSELELKYPTLNSEERDQFLVNLINLSRQNFSDANLLYNYRINRLTLPQWKENLYTRFCPKCLDKSAYHRIMWCLTHHTYCVTHLVYLVDCCPRCDTKTTIIDTVKGVCRCEYRLSLSNTESIDIESGFLTNEGEFKLVQSPFLMLKLTPTEQIKAIQRLLYCLLTKTSLEKLELSRKEIDLLAYGYYSDIKMLHFYLNFVRDLLKDWPS